MILFQNNLLPTLLVILEVVLGALLIVPNPPSFLILIILHLFACCSLAWWVSLRLPTHYVQKTSLGFFLFFTITFMVPVFGALGLLLSMYMALHYPKDQTPDPWEKISTPVLPFHPIETQKQSSFGQGGLANLILSAPDPERRLQAVIALRQVADRVAVPLLHQALKDPVDDIRLLAYAMLDGKEVGLNDKITSLLAKIESQDQTLAQGEEAAAHHDLAQNYWEMAYIGLATGNTLDYVLDKTVLHLLKAIELGMDGSVTFFLLGKTYLRWGKLKEATSYLSLALDKGHLESAVLPFMAEVAYEQNDFLSVRTLLTRLNEVCEGSTPIPLLVHAWQAHR